MGAVVTEVNIDIWSDVVCPWCYIGKRRFETAVAAFPHADELQIRWHSFQLDPSAPAEEAGTQAERLSAKYGTGLAQAEKMLTDMTGTAAAEGLDFHFDRLCGGNTFDAHRLLHLAWARGVQSDLEERLFDATFSRGLPVGDHATLTELAVEAGLDRDEVSAVLAGDDYATDVRADLAQARQFGITGVPFFVIDGKYGVSGAQPAELLGQALTQAWSERQPAPLAMVAAAGSAPGCEGDSCTV
ncbi:putative DsbA family dithiol-disulfide isomerase [Nakamurella flavida]|uniref:DsbA family oxidoreductase n=1 Tax=Nakamurella flavida TaxID=363630 RepID=UPI002789074C|nr:DsbA family oxidoreductase [Nakamurella flavida]MDP9779149.1 putative DsbA family dithiol-disulfide isomerase [Nakamurella flavida]